MPNTMAAKAIAIPAAIIARPAWVRQLRQDSVPARGRARTDMTAQMIAAMANANNQNQLTALTQPGAVAPAAMSVPDMCIPGIEVPGAIV